MEKLDLFKLLLKKHNYNNYRYKLDKEVFPEVLHDLYVSLETAHQKTTKDITCKDVWYVHLALNPTLTEAKKQALKDILAQINLAEDADPELSEYLFNKSLVELKATRIAQAALEIAQGRSEDFSALQSLLDDTSGSDDIEFVSSDVKSLTEEIAESYKWQFNLPDLDKAIGKIGPGLIIMAGPVNSGKSCMGLSFTFGPGGFAEQGARCVYVGNEENRKRLMLRAMSCYTGMTRDEILDEPEKAQRIYDKIKEQAIMVLNPVTNFSELTHITNKLRPDILVVDMLDKVQAPSSSRSEKYMQLGDIYARARDLSDRYQCAIFGLSQTNGDTFGQLQIDQNQLAGSRVDKAANGDLILTLGQLPSTDENNNFRCIYVAKTKSEGNNSKIYCNIQPSLSRIVS
jgi:archaellum biogenesis ATPase FlaH